MSTIKTYQKETYSNRFSNVPDCWRNNIHLLSLRVAVCKNEFIMNNRLFMKELIQVYQLKISPSITRGMVLSIINAKSLIAFFLRFNQVSLMMVHMHHSPLPGQCKWLPLALIHLSSCKILIISMSDGFSSEQNCPENCSSTPHKTLLFH